MAQKNHRDERGIGLTAELETWRPSALQPCAADATIHGLVPFARTVHRVLVLAFAAWMSLCCCEKRILAHAFDSAPEAARSCCSDGCCAKTSGGAPDQGDDAQQPGSCSDGCCVKGWVATQVFTPELDTIGALMPPFAVESEPVVVCGRGLSHEDRTAGEPPPRLALLISRRLRI